MSKHASFATRIGRPRDWALVAVRLLLLFSVWQGPLPWFHCHGALAEAGENQAWLIQHLQTHHRSVPLDAKISFGWHFHVDLPMSDSDGGDQDARKSCLAVSAIASQASAASCADLCPAPAFQRISPKVVSRPPCLSAAGKILHFFDSFADSLAVPLRFCVALN